MSASKGSTGLVTTEAEERAKWEQDIRALDRSVLEIGLAIQALDRAVGYAVNASPLWEASAQAAAGLLENGIYWINHMASDPDKALSDAQLAMLDNLAILRSQLNRAAGARQIDDPVPMRGIAEVLAGEINGLRRSHAAVRAGLEKRRSAGPKKPTARTGHETHGFTVPHIRMMLGAPYDGETAMRYRSFRRFRRKCWASEAAALHLRAESLRYGGLAGIERMLAKAPDTFGRKGDAWFENHVLNLCGGNKVMAVLLLEVYYNLDRIAGPPTGRPNVDYTDFDEGQWERVQEYIFRKGRGQGLSDSQCRKIMSLVIGLVD